MAIAAKTTTRKPRKKKAEERQVATIALPALADEHLDVPTLETWLWDAACSIRRTSRNHRRKRSDSPFEAYIRLSSKKEK